MRKKYKKAYLEITNQCNLNCSFCPKTKRTLSFMPLSQIKNAVVQIHRYTDYLYLHVMGEPLLHPELAKILKICEEEKLHVSITTNGTLLSSQKEILLSANIYKVQISLHSFEANRITRKLEEYLKEVWDFAAVFRGICVLRLWNLDQADIKGENTLNHQILSYFHSLSASGQTLEEWENSLKSGKDIKLSDRIFLQSTHKFEWPDLQSADQNTVFCYGLRDQFAVLVDGTVVPCCLDHEGDIPLGNLFREDLGDILSSPRAERLYQGFSEHRAVEPLCQKCQYATRFTK